MAKLELPDALKANVPPTIWGRILAVTPVVMIVLATALAGLASSEMTRAQYSRSLAAQLQSKTRNQWGNFQAKRLRSALQDALDTLRKTDIRPVDVAVLSQIGVRAYVPTCRLTLAALQKGELPQVDLAPITDPAMKAALKAIEDQSPDAELAALLAPVKDQTVADALRAARDRAHTLDVAVHPINRMLDGAARALASYDKSLTRDFIAARLRYTAACYDAEARLNQAIANLYEMQVRKANLDAERHSRRSQMFFYGMLGVMAAVIIATYSLATHRRNILRFMAAAAGVLAIFFACYIYLFM